MKEKKNFEKQSLFGNDLWQRDLRIFFQLSQQIFWKKLSSNLSPPLSTFIFDERSTKRLKTEVILRDRREKYLVTSFRKIFQQTTPNITDDIRKQNKFRYCWENIQKYFWAKIEKDIRTNLPWRKAIKGKNIVRIFAILSFHSFLSFFSFLSLPFSFHLSLSFGPDNEEDEEDEEENEGDQVHGRGAGRIILMGISKMRSTRDYFSKNPALNHPYISSRFSRDRFLHINDNATAASRDSDEFDPLHTQFFTCGKIVQSQYGINWHPWQKHLSL